MTHFESPRSSLKNELELLPGISEQVGDLIKGEIDMVDKAKAHAGEPYSSMDTGALLKQIPKLGRLAAALLVASGLVLGSGQQAEAGNCCKACCAGATCLMTHDPSAQCKQHAVYKICK